MIDAMATRPMAAAYALLLALLVAMSLLSRPTAAAAALVLAAPSPAFTECAGRCAANADYLRAVAATSTLPR
jgi:hypothetical protein